MKWRVQLDPLFWRFLCSIRLLTLRFGNIKNLRLIAKIILYRKQNPKQANKPVTVACRTCAWTRRCVCWMDSWCWRRCSRCVGCWTPPWARFGRSWTWGGRPGTEGNPPRTAWTPTGRNGTIPNSKRSKVWLTLTIPRSFTLQLHVLHVVVFIRNLIFQLWSLLLNFFSIICYSAKFKKSTFLIKQNATNFFFFHASVI